MLARAVSASVVGIEGWPVEVEVDVSKGIPKTTVVGLPDAAVKESRDRVRSALMNSGFKFPDAVVTINLAPADVRKEGPSFDLPIALAVLGATGQLSAENLDGVFLVGELALDGRVRGVKGILPMVLRARREGVKSILVPIENAEEAAIVDEVAVYGVRTLRDAVDFLNEESSLEAVPFRDPIGCDDEAGQGPDFNDVKGQESVKRALEIAVSGGHNLLMIGPPGSGKSMLAKRIPSIMPKFTLEEALETTKIHSVAGLLQNGEAIVRDRPFRSPHHTISDVGLIGGSANPSPGEVSLAHHGVLFLDELPEFKRSALEVMRQPLEDGQVTISRASGTLTFPSRFMFVAAMNPTQSGGFDDVKKGKVSSTSAQRYLNRISGPLLDRIDIHLEVSALKQDELMGEATGENSSTIRERVETAREVQRKRFARLKGPRIWTNAQMGSKEIRRYVPLEESSQQLLKMAMSELNLSARAYDRILRVARTIADLEGDEQVSEEHVSEAVQFRVLDRQLWR